jgi:hypothetical protein
LQSRVEPLRGVAQTKYTRLGSMLMRERALSR